MSRYRNPSKKPIDHCRVVASLEKRLSRISDPPADLVAEIRKAREVADYEATGKRSPWRIDYLCEQAESYLRQVEIDRRIANDEAARYSRDTSAAAEAVDAAIGGGR